MYNHYFTLKFVVISKNSSEESTKHLYNRINLILVTVIICTYDSAIYHQINFNRHFALKMQHNFLFCVTFFSKCFMFDDMCLKPLFSTSLDTKMTAAKVLKQKSKEKRTLLPRGGDIF